MVQFSVWYAASFAHDLQVWVGKRPFTLYVTVFDGRYESKSSLNKTLLIKCIHIKLVFNYLRIF